MMAWSHGFPPASVSRTIPPTAPLWRSCFRLQTVHSTQTSTRPPKRHRLRFPLLVKTIAVGCDRSSLHQPALPGQLQRFNRRTASPCRVAVRNNVNGNARLFFALIRHADTNFVHEPLLKTCARFEGSAAYDKCVRIEGVDHFVED